MIETRGITKTALAALLRWELRLQGRSPRTRVAVAAYLGLCAVPALVLFSLSGSYAFSPANYRGHLLAVQPFLSVVLAMLVAGQRTAHEPHAELWPVLASAPLGNAGWLLGRWVAVTAFLVPVTAVPVVTTTALAAAGGAELHDPAAWLSSWLFFVLPLAAAVAAAWLGAVTVLGSELAALAALWVGPGIFLGLLNQALLRFSLKVEGTADWLGFGALERQVGVLGWMLDADPRDLGQLSTTVAAEGLREQGRWLIGHATVGIALAVAVLGIGVGFVRRTRRDHRPRPIAPDHPLRTYLLLFARLREHLTPSAAPSRADRLVAVAAGLAFLGGLGFVIERQIHYRQLADERYRVETGDPLPPLGPEIVAESWHVRGRLEPSGRLELAAASRLTHRGDQPTARLAFELDESLRLAQVEAEVRSALGTAPRPVRVERHWDRLGVVLEPPLAPGETVELRFRLHGEPGDLYFPMLHIGQDAFVTKVEGFRGARFPRELTDLSRTRFDRAVRRHRIRLGAAELAPTPRYTPWGLTPFRGFGEGGRNVPPEERLYEADVEIELEVPGRFFLADPCGHTSHAGGSSSAPRHGRLAGRCRTVLPEYALFGGERKVTRDGSLTFAALPAHAERAQEVYAELAGVARVSDRAWPGLPGLRDVVVLEWTGRFAYADFWGGFDLRDRLLLMHEDMLQYDWLLDAEELVAGLLSRDLTARRSFAPEQAELLRAVFKTLMLQRMGVADQQDALLGYNPQAQPLLERPILGAPARSLVVRRRLPAVLADLRGRLGSDRLQTGIEAFLAGPADTPATLEELFTTLEATSGEPLGRFFDDFLAGAEIPELRLEEVQAVRAGEGFRVSGRVLNRGGGEVRCPLLVKTETGTLQLTVTLGAASEAPFVAPFETRTPSRPFRVQLDPEGTCHRLVTPGRPLAENADLSA